MNDLSPIRTMDATFRRPAPDLQSLAVEVVRRAMAQKGGAAVPTVREVLRRRLPFMRRLDRFVLRGLMLFVRRQIVNVSGIEHILTPHPFILALNHSTRREAVVVPAVLIFHRGGRLIHFWSDWMFRLIPGLGFLMRRAGTIVVATKPSRLPWVNLLKPLFERRPSAMVQARAHLDAKRPIGVFPEGTVSRDPRHLLPGRYGAARLSLETGVPIVPVGICFPRVAASVGVIPERAPMEIRIGAPLAPPAFDGRRPSVADVRLWHAAVMCEIARLSNRTWQPRRGDRETIRRTPRADAG